MTKQLRDIDAGERAQRIKTLTWVSPVAIPGYVGGYVLAYTQEWPLPMLFALAGAALFYVVFAIPALLLIERIGAAANQLWNPSGHMPAKRDYSIPAALAMQGKYEEAAASYADAVARFPDDPEPVFRLARLLRDRLGRPDEAARWLRRVQTLRGVTPEQDVLASRELIELCLKRLDRPGWALAELDRLARLYPSLPSAASAARERDELKERLRREAEAAEEAKWHA